MGGERLLTGGSWQIVRTSQTRWRRDLDPELQFLTLPGGGLLEVITHRRRRKGHWDSITRVASCQPDGDTWISTPRGRPWFGRKRWRIVAISQDWCVLARAKGRTQPAGVDVCARGAAMTSSAYQQALAALRADAGVSGFEGRLYAPGSSGDFDA